MILLCQVYVVLMDVLVGMGFVIEGYVGQVLYQCMLIDDWSVVFSVCSVCWVCVLVRFEQSIMLCVGNGGSL